MSSTFVSIKEHGFWMNDDCLELILRLLALHVPEPEDETTPERSATTRIIRDRWLLASRFHFMGCVPVHLDEAVSSQDGKIIVTTALRSLLHSLPSGPHVYDGAIYHMLGVSDPSRRSDIHADVLIETCQALLDLVDGKITWTETDGKYIRSHR